MKLGEVLLTILIIFFFMSTLIFNYSKYFRGEQQFTYLAKSFLQGKTYFLEEPGTWADTVFYKGHYYWPLGPFPAIVLMPFIYLSDFFGTFFYQGYLQFFITIGVFLLCFKISRKFGYAKWDSLFLAFAFCFASVYQLIAFLTWSWYFVQAMTVFLVLLAIYEYLGKRRYWLMGILFAGVFMSRFTAGFGILFFLLSKPNLKNSVAILTPVLISGFLLLGYNYVRFENPVDNGYMATNNATLTESERFELLNRGLFKLKNIPTNFYYYFIKTLDPVLLPVESFFGNTHILRFPYVRVGYPGTSFFVVSSIFLYTFRTRWKERLVKLSLVPIVIILLFLLSYYWSGWRQVGPRYMLDLLPFLYILLMFSFKKFKLTKIAKAIVLLSSLLDFYLFSTIAP
ncbi:hypothetical protein HY008_00495 [Candidatus Woesebacteria bacterium]|nr:hypothetical protein [Candidatus Woesebacteria bacterium]